MIFGALLIADEKEKKMICQYLRDLTAHFTDEKLKLLEFEKSDRFLEALDGADLLDAAAIDVTLPRALDVARQTREKFPKAEILVVADVSVSPMEYMHPSIRASALLLRPMGESWKDIVRDFYKQLIKRDGQDGQVLWVENRSGIFRIPLEQVYYIEAREKKVFIRTRAEEFGTNETIERLSEQLPDNFARCHRSFIVNTAYISQISLRENLLYLGEKVFVPVSRSYRSIFKRRFDE